MAKYTKSTGIQGAFVDKNVLKNGQRAKIVSETEPTPSKTFTDSQGNPQIQNIAKVRFEGQPEAVNVNLNRATINALVDAFGEDSMKWQGNYLTTEVEKVRVGGRAVVALYLIPSGYEKIDNADGYAEIVKKGSVEAKQAEQGRPQADEVEIPVFEDRDIPSDLPF